MEIFGYKYKSEIAEQSYKIDANDVGRYFEELHAEYGEITPKMIVEYARDENSLLHSIFEWNDSVAGEKWRLKQASQLLRNISYVRYETPIERRVEPIVLHKGDIESVEDENKNKSTEIVYRRAFSNVSMSENERAAYHPTEIVLQNDYAFEMLLEKAKNDCVVFKFKYDNLVHLSEVITAMDNFLNSVKIEKI